MSQSTKEKNIPVISPRPSYFRTLQATSAALLLGSWAALGWAMSAPKIVNDKRTLYVGACARAPRRPLVGSSHPTSPPGGLEESVTTEILHAAFLPFGEITDVNLVLDNATRARSPLHSCHAPVC